MKLNPLSIDTLEAAVHIEMMVLQEQGGPTEWQIEEGQRRLRLLAEGDASVSMFCASEETRSTFQIYVECIAILAFMPGGIRFAGRSFESCSSASSSSS